MQTRRQGMKAAGTLGCVIAVLFIAGSAPAFAVDIVDDPVQIDERAAQVVLTSNSLCWEMYRYHQQKPDYAPMYRAGKEIWGRAGDLRNALRAGPVETEVLLQQMTLLNEALLQLENGLSAWGDGDRTLVPFTSGPVPRTVVTPGVEVDIPFVGVRVGGPRVVTENGGPQLERRRLHPNSPGSRRNLEREFAALKVAVSYLLEDAGVGGAQPAQVPGGAAGGRPTPLPPTPAPQTFLPPTGRPPTPLSPESDPALGEPQKIVPPAKKPAAGPTAKRTIQ